MEQFVAPVAKRVHCEGLLFLSQNNGANHFAKVSKFIKALTTRSQDRSTHKDFHATSASRSWIMMKLTEAFDYLDPELKRDKADIENEHHCVDVARGWGHNEAWLIDSCPKILFSRKQSVCTARVCCRRRKASMPNLSRR